MQSFSGGITVSGLVAKRAALTGQIEHFQSQIRQLSIDLDHLDATLLLFNPDYDLMGIKPKGIRSSNAMQKIAIITAVCIVTFSRKLKVGREQ